MQQHVRLTLLLAGASVLSGQQYFLSTIAGGAPIHTPVSALNVPITGTAVATDAAGNLYLTTDGCVFKMDAQGVLTRVAGGGRYGDGGPATSAQLSPYVLAVDASGNLFLSDGARIRRVSTDGVIGTVAGTGIQGYCGNSGDGGPATSAQLSYVTGLAVDAFGNLFLVDSSNDRVRKVSASGIITTVAGNGTAGYSGDGGPATSSQLNSPSGVTVDASGCREQNVNHLRAFGGVTA